MRRHVLIGTIKSGWLALAARLCVCLLAWTIILPRPTSSAQLGETKRVLILHSFGRDFRPWGQYAKVIREKLVQMSPWQLHIQDHALVSALFSDENPEPSFVAYLNALNAKHPPDIVISIGAPAANFLQRNRKRLFSQIPMVLTSVEQRRIQLSNLSDNDTTVAVSHDFRLNFETILRVLPGTERIVVVNGTSPNEKFWLEEIRKDAKLLEDKVQFIWPDNISFQEFLKKSKAFPSKTAIFWHLMNVDATGVSYEGDAALRQLREITNAPVFSYDDGFFGHGETVGGPMYSVVEISNLTAEVAIRILGGEKPSDIRPSAIRYADPKFDWREMQRWGISESNLPPGSTIFFREPAVWQKYWWQSALIGCVILVQGALISGLLHERRRRRLAEVEARERLAELAHFNRYSAAGELTTTIAHELNQPLSSILTNTETVELMLCTSSPDLEEVKEILAEIRRDDQRAGEMIHRLRSMLKKVPFEVRDVDLNDAVREAVGFLTALTGRKGITIKYDPAATELHIRGDVVQLQQVVFNLIMNAMDAVSGDRVGKQEIIVATSRSDACAEIRVSDSGPGIAAGDIKKVFDPFFTTKPHGMGMGLVIVRTIIVAHQGQISVENQLSGGALFTIRLPIARGRSPSDGVLAQHG